MGTFHYQIAIGPKSDGRMESVEALVDTGSTHTVVPALLLEALGITPEWTSVFELADGRQQEYALAEVRLRLDDQERTTIRIF